MNASVQKNLSVKKEKEEEKKQRVDEAWVIVAWHGLTAEHSLWGIFPLSCVFNPGSSVL